jgi:hypothetical protein
MLTICQSVTGANRVEAEFRLMGVPGPVKAFYADYKPKPVKWVRRHSFLCLDAQGNKVLADFIQLEFEKHTHQWVRTCGLWPSFPEVVHKEHQ